MREPRDTQELDAGGEMPDRLVEEGQRRRLLEALVAVTAEVGYEDATPELIAARAGVPVARFHQLFGRKQVCFVAAYEILIQRLLARVEAAVSRGNQAQGRLQSGIAALLGWCEQEPQAARVCIVEVLAAGVVAQRQRERTMVALAAQLEPPLRELRPTKRLARLGSQAIVGASHELMYVALERGSTEGLPSLAGQLAAARGERVAA